MRLTEQVHLELQRVVQPGDTVIDATAGNGHDTLALAELIGRSGKVIAIDIQTEAIKSTRLRLEAAGQIAQCELIIGDHADELEKLLSGHQNCVKAITFNLGYLPGGDKEVTTSPQKTLKALGAAKDLLKPGGILLVIAYRGHPGGRVEAQRVATWMHELSSAEWVIETNEPPNRNPDCIPPVLLVGRKSG